MKQYSGERTIDGLVVKVDDVPLDPGFEVEVYDDKGYEWSYDGSAPRQLAFAILLDHFGDADKARATVDAFTGRVVANLDNDWILSSADIDTALS